MEGAKALLVLSVKRFGTFCVQAYQNRFSFDVNCCKFGTLLHDFFSTVVQRFLNTQSTSNGFPCNTHATSATGVRVSAAKKGAKELLLAS